MISISKSKSLIFFYYISHEKKSHFRQNNDVIAKMNVLFDKAEYMEGAAQAQEIAKSDDSNKVENSANEKDEDGKSIELAIKESLASGKVGALSVDPNYLEFEPLASKCSILYVT